MEFVGIEINGVAVPQGYVMRPGQQIVLVARLTGWITGDSVTFSIVDSAGFIVFGPVDEGADFGSTWVKLDAVAPSAQGNYLLVGKEVIPFHSDDTKTFPFGVSAAAPPPPTGGDRDGGGIGGIFKDLKGILIAGAVVAGVVMLAPAVLPVATRVGRAICRSREESSG